MRKRKKRSLVKKVFYPFDMDSLENRDLAFMDWLVPPLGELASRYFRARVRGVENVPRGKALYTGNHNMPPWSLDTLVFLHHVYQAHGRDSLPYFLGHENIKLPPFNQIVPLIGAILAGHDNARKAFARGSKVMVYPGGDLDAGRPFAKRNRIVFGGRTGYIRLALLENVPIVPVVTQGAHSAYIILHDFRWVARKSGLERFFRLNVCPVSLSFPLGLTPLPPIFFIPFPTRIKMEILPPVRFPHYGEDWAKNEQYVRECADQVETLMQDCLTSLAGE